MGNPSNDLLSPEGLRIDGRRANELRRIESRLDVHFEADGSALLQIGLTKVIALIYGPHETKAKGAREGVNVNVEFKISPYAASTRRYRSKNDRRALEMGIFIKQAFEQVILPSAYPKSQIDIVLQVVESDGGVLHTCINATSLALINAGIPMYDYLCACSSGFIDATPVLDLSQFEEASAYDIPKFTVAVMPASGKVVLLHLESRMPFDKFEQVRNMAVEGARQIRQILDKSVRLNLEQSQGLISSSRFSLSLESN